MTTGTWKQADAGTSCVRDIVGFLSFRGAEAKSFIHILNQHQPRHGKDCGCGLLWTVVSCPGFDYSGKCWRFGVLYRQPWSSPCVGFSLRCFYYLQCFGSWNYTCNSVEKRFFHWECLFWILCTLSIDRFSVVDATLQTVWIFPGLACCFQHWKCKDKYTRTICQNHEIWNSEPE